MTIANYLIALSIISCPIASIQANIFSEFSKIKKDIEWSLKDDSTEHGRLIQQISLCFLERDLQKELRKLQWECKECYTDINYYEEEIHAILTGEFDSWFFDEASEEEKPDTQNRCLRKIEKKRNKIAELDLQVAELQDYITRVQEWKNSLR